MRTYQVYVHRDNDVLSDSEMVKQYLEDRTGHFLIKEKFVSNYDIRTNDLVTLSEESDEFVYRIKLVIVQSTQIALLCEVLK